VIDCQTETPNALPQRLTVRTHTFRADLGPASGGEDTAPAPHDFFDASLAACKALTALWYARRNGIPLERVETHVERDDREEKAVRYTLRVRVAFHCQLTVEQRQKLHEIVGRCPVHKLMTTTDVSIETAPLEPA
jgi:putative redox protein